MTTINRPGIGQVSARRTRRLTGPAVAIALSSTLLCLAAPAVAADPLQPRVTHCPAALTLVSATDFPEPYQSFMLGIDASGNNNGLVCEKPAEQAAANQLDPKFGLPVGAPLYQVTDDSIVKN